jgi:pyruvate,orthophosphate dikinase
MKILKWYLREHGGEPSSVNLSLVNGRRCSPFRVPIARLAAARAVLKEKETKSGSSRSKKKKSSKKK